VPDEALIAGMPEPAARLHSCKSRFSSRLLHRETGS